VNALDVLLVTVAVAAAVGGYRLGLVTRAVSWAGLIVGLGVGARLLPGILRAVRPSSSHAQLFAVAVVVLVACGVTGQVIGLLLGGRVSVRVRSPRGRQIDQVLGGIAGVCGLVVAAWLLLPGMASVPGIPARLARGSALAHELDSILPAAPDTSRAMRRLVGDQYPEVFDALRPTPDLGTPPAVSGLSGAVARRVVASTVKVDGRACQVVQEGSGFVVAPGLVATNAHVVAGESSTYVTDGIGLRHGATVVAFDPERDLALLEVPDLDEAPLHLSSTAIGGRGAVFGHPEGGPLTLAPFRVGDKVHALGTDIYDHESTSRLVLVLASDLHPGDSGGALVDSRGDVVGIAFAVSPDRGGVAYALDPSELQPLLATRRRTAVSTGPCVG
jgi:S1-C subfamily serine protease